MLSTCTYNMLCFRISWLFKNYEMEIEDKQRNNREVGKEREKNTKKVNQAKCTDDKAIVH